ncbi:murein transglycosylase [Caballeronia jiangsuensis]|nr:murein transglycosylase [Caballeronia jiangsuensis]
MLNHTPAGLDEIIDTFGSLDVPDFQARYIVPFELPYPLYFEGKKVLRARCHYLLCDNFIKAFSLLQERKLDRFVQNYGGIYARRPIRGQTSHASTHSWGIAIDLEPEKYPLGSKERFPPEVVDTFTECGFLYGGDFKGRKDPMHFQFATHY